MITAIFVIVIMAAVSALVLSLSGRMTKATAIQYRQEQAALLARSYTELAVMAVMNYDRDTAGNCIEDIDGVVNGTVPGVASTGSSAAGSGYNVQTRIYYIGDALPCSGTRKLNTAAISTDYNDTGTPHSSTTAAIIVDVYVRYKDPDVDNPATAPWITYHRRTLQKI